MISVVEDHRDYATWADLVAACGGNPLHLDAVTAADYAGIPVRHLIFEGARSLSDDCPDSSTTVACGLAYGPTRRRWRIVPNGRDLDLPTAPAITSSWRNPEQKHLIYDALITFAHRAGYRRLIVHPRFGEDMETLPHLARYRMGATLEFVVDLNREWEAVRGAMHKFHRKNIRRAERQGLEVVSDPSVSGLLRLRDLQLHSAQRSAERGGGFHVRERAYFETLHHQVYGRGLGDVLFARSGSEVLAGLAFVTAGRKGITVRSGCTPEGYERSAMYLLQDAVLRLGHDRGLAALNLGGVPAQARETGHVQHGLYEFKRGFGGQECLRRGLMIPLEGVRPPTHV